MTSIEISKEDPVYRSKNFLKKKTRVKKYNKYENYNLKKLS